MSRILNNQMSSQLPGGLPLPPIAPRRRLWAEIAKFIGIFLFFFILLSLVVMGPTIYTKLAYYFFTPEDNQYNLPVTVADNLLDIEEVSELFESQEFIPAQDMIIIPKINVDAPIIYMETRDNQQILEDIKQGVGHYSGTALPGRVGNAFMTAHSSYYWWSGGKYNQVFALLDRLVPGDLIYIYHEGGKYIYRVRESFVIRPTQTEVLQQGQQPILTLMTCVPIGTNLKRLIVQADLIGRPPVDTADFDEFSTLPPLPIILPLY